MKKILALVFCFIFAFSLCGCKDKEENNSKIDLEYYANLGQIPESQFKLGDNGDTVYSAWEKEKQEMEAKGEEYGLELVEGENNVLVTNGIYECYYKKSSQNKEIGYMVSYTDAYGLKMGTVSVEVEKALQGYDLKEEQAYDGNAFFYLGDYANATVLIAELEKNSIMFLFEDNALCATAIYSNDWK